MGRASDAPAAASAGTRVAPKTPASSPPSAGRSQNAGPLRAGSQLQSEPHIEPERKAPRPSSPGPCHLPTKAICCRIFTPALPDYPAAAEGFLLRRLHRLKQLSAKGDALERLSAVVDFELFRADLERAVPRSDGSKGGRPAFDHVLMFKVLVLQASHSLSDERTEYLIRDRLSFMRFLGLGLADTVPDANTIWT